MMIHYYFYIIIFFPCLLLYWPKNFSKRLDHRWRHRLLICEPNTILTNAGKRLHGGWGTLSKVEFFCTDVDFVSLQISFHLSSFPQKSLLVACERATADAVIHGRVRAYVRAFGLHERVAGPFPQQNLICGSFLYTFFLFFLFSPLSSLLFLSSLPLGWLDDFFFTVGFNQD